MARRKKVAAPVENLDAKALQVVSELIQQKTDGEVANSLGIAEEEVDTLRTRGLDVLSSGIGSTSSNLSVGLELLQLDVQAKDIWTRISGTEGTEYRNLMDLLTKNLKLQHEIRMDAGLIVKRKVGAGSVGGIDLETADLSQLSEAAETLVEDVVRLLPRAEVG